jgi:hypothetical protein
MDFLHLLSATNAVLAFTAIYLIALRPRLADTPRAHVMVLTAPHLFRYLGLVALYPALFPVRSLGFSKGYLTFIAWGDTVAGWLALLAFVALARRWQVAIALTWIAHLWGLADFLNAGVSMAIPLAADPAALGPLGWLLLTLYLPMLLVAHIAALSVLWRLRSTKVVIGYQ